MCREWYLDAAYRIAWFMRGTSRRCRTVCQTSWVFLIAVGTIFSGYRVPYFCDAQMALLKYMQCQLHHLHRQNLDGNPRIKRGITWKPYYRCASHHPSILTICIFPSGKDVSTKNRRRRAGGSKCSARNPTGLPKIMLLWEFGGRICSKSFAMVVVVGVSGGYECCSGVLSIGKCHVHEKILTTDTVLGVLYQYCVHATKTSVESIALEPTHCTVQ